MMRTGILFTFLILALLFIGFSSGLSYRQATYACPAPQIKYIDRWHYGTNYAVVERPVPYPVPEPYPVEKIKEVEKIVEVTKEVEVLPEGYENFGYVPFKSNAEIEEYVEETGIVFMEYVDRKFDCDDFGFWLATEAGKDARPIFPLMITDKDGFWHFDNYGVCPEYVDSLKYGGLAAVRGKNHIVYISPQSGHVFTTMFGYEVKID